MTLRLTIVLLLAASPLLAQEKPQCVGTPLPVWSDLTAAKAVPDYINVADNVRIAQNLRILASAVEKAMAEIASGESQAGGDASGVCLCKCDKTAAQWVSFLGGTVAGGAQQALQKTKDRYVSGLRTKLDTAKASLFDAGPAFTSAVRTAVENACKSRTCAALDGSDPAALQQQAAEAVDTKLAGLFGPLDPESFATLLTEAQTLLAEIEELLKIVESSDRTALLLDPQNQKKLRTVFARTTALYENVEKTFAALAELDPQVGTTDLGNALRASIEASFADGEAIAKDAESAARSVLDARIQTVQTAAGDLFDTATNVETVLDDFTAELQDGLLRDLTQVQGCYGLTPRKDCTLTAFCRDTEQGMLFGSPDLELPLWLPTDVFKDGESALRWALDTIDWLERAKRALTSAHVESTAKLQELLALLDDDNLAEVQALLERHVNTFTEGYHLGGYSHVRPDLHMCVGYAGHGVLAELFSAAGGDFRGGASYLSASLSTGHRARLQTGGFTIFINGRSLPLAPGVSLNTQFDGFRLWDENHLFGIPDLSANVELLTRDDIAAGDAFHLIKCCDDKRRLDCITCPFTIATAFYDPRFPVRYAGQQWPGPGCEEDEPLAAVLGAGLNLDLRMRTRSWSTTPIPVFPGASLKPWLKLDAGVNWDYEVNSLRDTLLASIRKNLSGGPTADVFLRDFHPFQAPDVSEDVANGARVKPRLGADLVIGLSLASWLTIGITANLYVGVDVSAAGFGGVIDFNRALVDALAASNPPPGDCRGTIDPNVTRACSNTAFLEPVPCENVPKDDEARECADAPAGALYSTGVYTCDGDSLGCSGGRGYCTDARGTIVLHDVTRDQCEAASLAPRCIATYRDHPSEPGTEEPSVIESAVSTLLAGTILPGDPLDGEQARAQFEADFLTTKEQCESAGWCFNWGTRPDSPAELYSAIFQAVVQSREHCPAATYDDGSTVYDNRCSYPPDPFTPLPSQFIRFTWVDPGEFDPEKADRRFHPYQCVQRPEPKIADYKGPDCNPIEFGYPSACPPGENCFCDDKPCPDDRVCVRGVCLQPCDVKPCGDDLACRNGVCLMANSVPFAEQIVAEMRNVAKPQHAVATYGLNKLITSAVLGFGLRAGMEYRLFRKWRSRNLFDFREAIPLVELPLVKHQLGLEAQYQDDRDLEIGRATNHQPSMVRRYGSTDPATPTSALLAWCKPAIAADAQNPPPLPPVEERIDGELTKVFTFGKEIGVDFWARGQLCAGGKRWDEYLSALQSDPKAIWEKLECTYDSVSIDCNTAGALQGSVAAAIGCMSAADPLSWNGKLLARLTALEQAHAFLLPPTTAKVLDLRTLLTDPKGELVKENVADSIRALQQTGFSVDKWLAALNTCVNDADEKGGGQYHDTKLEIRLKLDGFSPCGGVCCIDGVCREVTSQVDCPGVFRPGTNCDEELCEETTVTPPPGGACMLFGRCQQVASAEQCQGAHFYPGRKCGDPPAICSDNAHCPPGTWCRPTEDGGNECVPFQPPGAHCSGFVEPWFRERCAPHLVCTDFIESTGDLGGYCRVACASAPSALAAWWPLDETAGPVAAEHRARFDGALVRPPASIAGAVGRALSFDGVDDYVEVPDAPDLNFGTGDFTFAAWIRTPSARGTEGIVDKRSTTGSRGYHIALVNGRPVVQLGDGKLRSYVATGAVTAGKWHFVAVAVDRDRADGIRFYVDGEPAGAADPRPSSGSITSAAPLRFARRTLEDISVPWRGALDEPMLFSRALAAAEVRRMYDAGTAGICKCVDDRRALEALWLLDDVFSLDVVSLDVVHLQPMALINGPQHVEAMAGSGITFDGIDDYGEAAASPRLNLGTDDFTISAWVRTSQTSGLQSILDKRSGGTGYHFYLSDGRPGLQLADGTPGDYTSTAAIADGQWHFVAVTVDRDRKDGVRWYVDGRAAGTGDATPHQQSLNNDSTLRVATRMLTNDGWWNGSLDELAIYRRALSPAEAVALFRAGSEGLCAESRRHVVR